MTGYLSLDRLCTAAVFSKNMGSGRMSDTLKRQNFSTRKLQVDIKSYEVQFCYLRCVS